MQQSRHLIDEGACAPGAYAVHPLVQTVPEVDDLGVLAPQLDGNIRLGCTELQGGSYRYHLLHEGQIHGFAQIDGAGAGDAGVETECSQPVLGIDQKIL